MSEKKNEELQGKKRPGRKAMTPAEKEAAAKVRAAEKEKASQMRPEFIMQFQGADTNLDTLAETAIAKFHEQKKRTRVTSLKLYIKPEERKAYYVVNEKYTGDIIF